MPTVDTENLSATTAPAAVRELRERLGRSVSQHSDDSVVAGIRDLETLARLVNAEQARLLGEAVARGLPRQHGARTTSSWLQRMLRITPSDAKTRMIAAEAVHERTALSGEPLPPELPATAEALSQGAIGLEHARTIAEGIEALPPSVDHDDRQWAERTLVEQAHTLPPDKLRIVANRIRYHYDQDGSLRDDEHQHERRELHLARARDGMTVLKARLDKETGAKLWSALAPLAAPRPADDGERDPRSTGQRNADALEALVDIALASNQLPTSGGQRAQLAVTINYETLRSDLGGQVRGSGTLESTGEPISASAARRLACDSHVIPIVLGAHSEPLDIGRTSYTVPKPMRQALLARDGSCAFPSCDRPPGTSHAHHARHWIDGGETSVDNLVMLCGADHRRVHAEGWHVRIREGKPEFVPPSWIDPHQTPQPGQGRDPTQLDLVR